MQAGLARFLAELRRLLALTAAFLAGNLVVKRLVTLLLMLIPGLRGRLQQAVRGHFAAAAAQPVHKPSASRSKRKIPQVFDVDTPAATLRDQQARPFTPPRPKGERILYVYVDHTVGCATHTGVQRVVRGVGEGLAAVGEEVRYVKWDPESQQCLLISWEEREHLARWNGPATRDDERRIYPAADAEPVPVAVGPKGENHWLIVPEVTHLTFHAQPPTLDLILWGRRTGLKIGFVFYDAIPLRRPELAGMRPVHEAYMRQLRLADVVWPISDWSGRDLTAFWTQYERADRDTTPEIQTIHLPGAGGMSARPEASKAEPLILSVGSIEPRKNQTALVRAFQSYRRKHPDSPWRLALVGNLHPAVSEEIGLASQADPAIRYLGHLPEDELEALFGQCAFTSFPSLEEGFGLPILESLWRGKPCLCANFGAMAEVAEGGGCLTVDTADPAALTAALERLIDDADLRARFEAEARARPWSTWADYARTISARIDQEADPLGRLGPIYYWVDAAAAYPRNTGIQRVTRQLARSLIDAGFALIPVKFDPAAGCFAPVSDEEKLHLAGWNGPAADAWRPWTPPEMGQNGWFLMSELPLDRSTADQQRLVAFARKRGLKTAAVFYDATPWKLSAIFPEIYSERYRDLYFEYMNVFMDYDLVLPISHFSGRDLIDALGASAAKPQSLQGLVVDAPLPCEFPGVPRNRQIELEPAGTALEIVCIGTVEPRKNHLVLAEAFALAVERSSVPLSLTIAGGAVIPALTDRLNALIEATPSIRWERELDDAQISALLGRCAFTVYPSIEEGFGLPIAESLWYAKPCICADFGAMAEVAEGGGCLSVNVRDKEALASAIVRLAEDRDLRRRLAEEAVARPVKSWADYGFEVASRMAEKAEPRVRPMPVLSEEEAVERAKAMALPKRPKLSVCISTYNRAEWLSASLRNWVRLYPKPIEGVELLVCDNTSTDHTPEVVEPYLGRADFSYHRNPQNVGMLGNLRETSHHARGDYIWILGDDDLIVPGAVERVLAALERHPETALVYLNYAFTRLEDARTISNFDAFFREATPIVPSEPDLAGPIREICARNENFFTAIYTLVLRRDHAINAYSQDTSGRPFSTMPTCIPTTHYALHHLMAAPGVWIGAPQLVVNMNVSWLRYAPLWILERIPEVYEIAERNGVPAEDIDRWRRHTLPGVVTFFEQIFRDDPLNNAAYFSPARLVRRFKHLDEFDAVIPHLEMIYKKAQAAGHPAATAPVSRVFPN